MNRQKIVLSEINIDNELFQISLYKNKDNDLPKLDFAASNQIETIKQIIIDKKDTLINQCHLLVEPFNDNQEYLINNIECKNTTLDIHINDCKVFELKVSCSNNNLSKANKNKLQEYLSKELTSTLESNLSRFIIQFLKQEINNNLLVCQRNIINTIDYLDAFRDGSLFDLIKDKVHSSVDNNHNIDWNKVEKYQENIMQENSLNNLIADFVSSWTNKYCIDFSLEKLAIIISSYTKNHDKEGDLNPSELASLKIMLVNHYLIQGK